MIRQQVPDHRTCHVRMPDVRTYCDDDVVRSADGEWQIGDVNNSTATVMTCNARWQTVPHNSVSDHEVYVCRTQSAKQRYIYFGQTELSQSHNRNHSHNEVFV